MRLIGFLFIAISTLAICTAQSQADTASDLIESRNVDDLQAAGWNQQDKTDLSVSQEAKAGKFSLKVTAQNEPGDYRGVELHRAIDLTGAQPRDRLVLNVKQSFGTGMVIQLWTEEGNVNRSFDLKQNEWTRVELDMDLKRWENPKGITSWGKVNRIQFYAKNFNAAGQFMMMDGLTFTVNGKRISPVESEQITDWNFPQQTETTWRIGTDKSAWAISKSTGQIVGGWNAQTKENYLLAVEDRYHLADRKSLVTGMERQDKVIDAKFDEKTQTIELVCNNPVVPDLTITKKYWVDGDKLYQRTGFTTKSSDLQFITYNSQAVFDKAYRDAGYYMGGGDGGFPLLPAPDLVSWHKVLEYQNTTKGMVLSQPEKSFSFAHIRTRLDDQFVWPWYTGAIATYCEAENVLNYTPDGWDMSLGTSKLSQAHEVSYEQYFSIFEGNWFTFLSHEYPSLQAVQKAYSEIPPTPAWVADVKADTFGDIHKLKHLVEMTDEGTIMVLVDFGGSWADYYVDQGLEGSYAGGHISGPEIKDLIQRIKAVSPRIKVGIYMWQLSTLQNTRIYKEHPEWFRTYGKDGELVNTFPGLAVNFAHLLSIPECYDALLSQFDLVLSYLDTDFIYLDDPKAINPIDWPSGEYTRDDLSYRYMLDIKKIAAKHGPDKMVFFNNRGNPYADINYIEARGQMNPDYWRVFSGIATIIETNLNLTPQARIVPLYYTTPYQREYINRVLALGWIPEASSSNVTELLERRAFLQAAYEIGNALLVPAGYSPDWKLDKDTKIESYPMQRNGDAGYFFSFISHLPETAKVPVSLDLNTLKLNKDGQVFVWKYLVENGLEYKGTVTERLAREVYGNTGWLLDHVTRRELIYAGPYSDKLALDLEMTPLELNQLYITSQVSAVYSENHLPGNYLFGKMPKVTLDEQIDWASGKLNLQVQSDRDQAELIAFLPQSTHQILQATIDGQPASVDYVWEGNDVFPVVKVGKGTHAVAYTFEPKPAAKPGVVTAAVSIAGQSDSQLQVGVADYDRALITISRNDRVLFNRMVQRSADGKFALPLAPARGDAGEYAIQLRAVADKDGRIQLAQGSVANVQFPAAIAENALPPVSPPIMEGAQEIVDINREIGGIKVLRSATQTTNTIKGSMQPDMSPLMARTDPEKLLLEAGTTSKMDYLTRGAAFAGFEIENLRKARIRLSNTFYNAVHVFGAGIHTPPWNTGNNYFAGIVVDYHTSAGYTKRVHLSTGVRHSECSSIYPSYGKEGIADSAFDLGKAYIETPEQTFALDLAQYAPSDWDGRVWLSVGSDWIASDRRMTLEILAANDAVTDEIVTASDPKAFREAYLKPKTITVPRSPGGILIDGVINEEMWREAVMTDQFFLHGGEGVSKAKTEARLLYDDTHLYIAFTCAEPSRSKPLVQGGAIWDDDEIEVWIDTDGKGESYRQILINGANNKMEYSASGVTAIGVVSATHVYDGHSWSVEMMIPYKGLGVAPPKPGDQWRISLCRYRPAGKDFSQEIIVWAPLIAEGFKDLANFGTLVFK